MAGLLGDGFDDPRSAAVMALAGGMLKGDLGGGLMGSQLAYGQARKGLLDSRITDAQLRNYDSEIEARKLKVLQDQRQQEMDRQFLGLGGAPAGAPAATGGPGLLGAAPAGGPAASGAPAGGFTAQQISQQFGIPMEAVMADYRFNSGKKIAELISERSKPNWQNVNGNLINTNDPNFKGGIQAGISAGQGGQVTAWQPDGQGGLVVGAPRGALDTFKAYQGVGERTKAAFDPVKVFDPAQQREVYSTREQVTQGTQPAPMPRLAASEAGMRAQMSGGMGADPMAADREIQKITASLPFVKDPASRQLLQEQLADLQRQKAAIPAGPMAAGPSMGEANAAAAAKVKAEADARAQSERETGRTKKGDAATDMLGNIARARTLLEMGPTGSLLGAGVDKLAGAVGMTTPSGSTANSLETLSGWLTSNTPRMEGPQSDRDAENYKIMAGRVGDRTIPAKARLDALKEVEMIQKKYAGLNASGPSSDAPKANLVASLPKTAARGSRARDTATGDILEFNGMSWVKAK